MDRKQPVFDFLDARGIRYEWYEHPEAPTIEIARQWWRDDGSKHCKNLFFRNHKGDRHYLVCFDSKRGCIRENCRSPRPSAWNAGWDCAPARSRPSG